MRDLSVIIPARKEEWLQHTGNDVLAHREADTEIIVVLDEDWPEPGLVQHPDVTVVHVPRAIGQRAATNLGARISEARYICKLDAHCSMDQGFDRKLIEAAEALGRDVTQIPSQKNLHVYDQVCVSCGHRADQAPNWLGNVCPKCGGAREKAVVWKPRGGSTTVSWYFDTQPKFQYGGRPPRNIQGDQIVDVMSSLGACFFMDRERYWQLGGLDEGHGSWGSLGIEVACKSWLSGGRHVVNKATWFSHFFRVGGINFPYEIKGSDQEKARTYSRNLWFNNAWPGQTRPLSWLIEHFYPVPGWHDDAGRPQLAAVMAAGKAFDANGQGAIRGREESISGRIGGAVLALGESDVHNDGRVGGDGPRKGIIYYTDGKPKPYILEACRKQLEKAGLPIVAVSLKPLEWPAATVIQVGAERGYLTMAKQILTALEWSTADVIFFAEHDVLYHPSHFEFTPPTRDLYYYDLNTWKVDAKTGKAITYITKQLSGLCADRQLLIEHFRKRVAKIEADGFSRAMGFEPGSHHRKERIDDIGSAEWRSEVPNIDIRHDSNLTANRFDQSQFRDQRHCQGWQEATGVPGWGETQGRFSEFLNEAVCA